MSKELVFAFRPRWSPERPPVYVHTDSVGYLDEFIISVGDQSVTLNCREAKALADFMVDFLRKDVAGDNAVMPEHLPAGHMTTKLGVHGYPAGAVFAESGDKFPRGVYHTYKAPWHLDLSEVLASMEHNIIIGNRGEDE